MKKNKLRTAGLLMTISILLLLLFQAYWLRNAYRDEYRRLRRELSVTLRESVVRQQMQIFLIQRDKQSRGDTTWTHKTDSNNTVIIRTETAPIAPPGAQVKVAISTGIKGDTSKRNSRSNFFFDNERHFDDEIQPGEMKVEFPTPFGIENLSAIEKDFRKNLADAHISLPFTLIKKAGDSTMLDGMARFRRNVGEEPRSSAIRLKAEILTADFGNPFFYILKRLQWQLLFAFSMLVVTLAAFIFLYRNLRQQHQLAAIKNDFIANMTHELKTPVATVSVAIEALKNFNAMNDTERTKEYLDISALELQRLGLLVDKVMKLSMFEQDKMEIQQELVDMQQLLDEVVKSMRLQFEKAGALVDVSQQGTHFTTRGDRMHLQSVLFNLLDNALKYSPDEPSIQIALIELPKAVQLKVSDNGIGIATEYRQRVFEKFFRVPHDNTHNIKGYGLGLSYVYEVVERHGGTISVESREGKGSIFTVDLPLVDGK